MSDIDWTRYVLQVGIVVGIYYVLFTFSPLPRQPRKQQFAIFGGITFVALLIFGLIYPA